MAAMLWLLLAPFSVWAGPAPEKITLQLKWRHQFQFAGYYAAMHKGYYARAGLEVALREPAEGQTTAGPVLGGAAQYGVAASDLVLLRSQGKPVVALAAIFQHSPLVILAKPEVDNLHGLAGRAVAMEPHAAELLAYMQNEGLSPAKLKFLPHAFSVRDFLSGQVAAMSAYSTDEPYSLRRAGAAFITFSPRSAGIDFYGDTLYTSERELAEHPERVDRFLAASLAGWDYALKNPGEIIDLILAKYSQRHGREHLAFEARATAGLIQAKAVKIGRMTRGRWQHIADTYASLGLMPANFDLDGFVYKDPSGNSSATYGLLLTGALLLLVLAGTHAWRFFLLNRKLKEQVAQREAAQEKLAERECLLSNIIEILPIGLWIADKDGNLISANPAGVKIWGGRPLVGQEEYRVFRARRLPGREEIAPDDWALAHTITKGETITDELLEIDALDGQTRTILNYTAPVLDSQGRVTAAIIVNQDITQRQKAEEALKESEEVFKKAFQTSPDSVNINRMSDGMYVDINQGFTRITGYTWEDVAGKTSLDLDIWADPADRETLVRGLREKGYYENLKARFRRKDGKIITALMSAAVITVKGEPHLINITRDITEIEAAQQERERLQAQLRQAQKMEAVGTLAGGIAHDFNNILAAINGFTELALDSAERGQTAPDDLKEVLACVDRAKELVNNILAFSRKTESQFHPLDVNRSVRQAGEILRRTIPLMVSVELSLQGGLPSIRGDEVQLQQVLLNLGANAKDAMPEGGRLEIKTELVSLDEAYCQGRPEARPGPHVLLTVADSGEGIEPEVMEHIFDPFFTTKDVGQGTGLGLAMAYGAVKGHHGHITCESQPGRGTTFRVYLPVWRGAGKACEPAPGAGKGAAQGCGETVLVVDDEPGLREIARINLETAGYRVLLAASGEEALEVYKERGADIALVLLDIGMPGMGGVRCIRELMALDQKARVIMASGYAIKGSVEQALAHGAKEYIAKPFRREDLLAAARRVLDE